MGLDDSDKISVIADGGGKSHEPQNNLCVQTSSISSMPKARREICCGTSSADLALRSGTKAWQSSSFVRATCIGLACQPTARGQDPPAPKFKPRCHNCSDFIRRYQLRVQEAGAVDVQAVGARC